MITIHLIVFADKHEVQIAVAVKIGYRYVLMIAGDTGKPGPALILEVSSAIIDEDTVCREFRSNDEIHIAVPVEIGSGSSHTEFALTRMQGRKRVWRRLMEEDLGYHLRVRLRGPIGRPSERQSTAKSAHKAERSALSGRGPVLTG
jgi:hypothetical protein